MLVSLYDTIECEKKSVHCRTTHTDRRTWKMDRNVRVVCIHYTRPSCKHARKHIGCTITTAHYFKLYDRRRCSSLQVADLSYFALACHQPSGHLPATFIPAAITRRIFHHSDKCDVCLRICGANLSTSAANLECQATSYTDGAVWFSAFAYEFMNSSAFTTAASV